MVNNLHVCILAGGRGTRFLPFTDIVPKPMIPVGPEEKPLLEYIIQWIKKYGFNKFILLVKYRWKQIRNYFGDGSRFGVKITYSIDQEPYKGTGGALVQAYDKGLLDSKNILIWYGDIIAPIDLGRLVNEYQNSDPDALVVVTRRYRVPVGIATIKDGRIIDLREKPWINVNATIGILLMKTSVLGEARKTLGSSFDIMGDLMPWMIKKGYFVKPYIYDGEWYDIGSLEKYVKLDHNRVAGFLNL